MSIPIDQALKRLFSFECNVSKSNVSKLQVEQVEKELGIIFPDSYKKFLLYTNGGNFFETEEFFRISAESDQTATTIQNAIKEFSEVLKKNNLPNSIPIHNGLGFHLLSEGKVYEVDIDSGSIHSVFDTFTSFLNELIEEYQHRYPEIEHTMSECERKSRLSLAVEKGIKNFKKE